MVESLPETGPITQGIRAALGRAISHENDNCSGLAAAQDGKQTEGMNMAMTTTEAIETMMQEDETSLVKPEVGALEAITRSEVAMQLDSAHRWPRSIGKFVREATSLATLSVEIAESCMYAVPRDGKEMTGPSVRLAEMIASSWGNLHVGSRIVDIGEREVTAQAVAWDLEKNVRVTVEVQRNILTKNGKRFGDSMIQTTCAAAASIALRNAVFRVVPRAYVEAVYAKARECAIGDLQTLGARREAAFTKFAKLGVTPDRMLARLGIKGPDDFTLEHLETLVGMYTAIKSGELSIDDAFPAPAPSPVPAGTPEGKRVKLPGNKTKGAAAPPVAPSGPPSAAPAEPKAAAPGELVDVVELHETLAEVDDSWTVDGASLLLQSWNEQMRREALTWAQAVAENGPMAIQVKRPAHTIIGRQPGDD